MKTIRKNSKKFTEVINSKGWMSYSLSSDFKGIEVESVAHETQFSFIKLTESENGYTLRIHSNHWYTKSK